MELVEYSREHLAGLLSLCEDEGWRTLPADHDRADRALTAPGVVARVAVDRAQVVGFVQLMSDGEIQAYLCNLVVAPGWRRRGLGRRLVHEAFRRSGALRIDLLAEEGSTDFYRSFDNRQMQGFRIDPRTDGPAT